jgi:hypothetical protein
MHAAMTEQLVTDALVGGHSLQKYDARALRPLPPESDRRTDIARDLKSPKTGSRPPRGREAQMLVGEHKAQSARIQQAPIHCSSRRLTLRCLSIYAQ